MLMVSSVPAKDECRPSPSGQERERRKQVVAFSMDATTLGLPADK